MKRLSQLILCALSMTMFITSCREEPKIDRKVKEPQEETTKKAGDSLSSRESNATNRTLK
ncbi:hypothetical protein [Gangjinia marincola]